MLTQWKNTGITQKIVSAIIWGLILVIAGMGIFSGDQYLLKLGIIIGITGTIAVLLSPVLVDAVNREIDWWYDED